MKNLIVLVAMVATGVAGYFIGAHEGKAAKETLARVEQAAKDAAEEHQKTKTALDKRIGELTTESAKKIDRINQEYKKQKADWNALLAGRDKRIKDITAANNMTQKEIERLRIALGISTSPEERKALEKQITQLQAILDARDGEIVGLVCSKIKVPTDMLNKLKGEMP